MSERTVRIHIHNDSREPAALQLTPEILEAALAARPALAGRIVATYGDATEDLPDVMADARVLFTATKLSLAEARLKAPALEWTQTMTAGIEAFLPSLPADMVLTNASGVHSEKGGEFVLAAALMLSYAIPQFLLDQAVRVWNPVFTPTMSGRRVLILGTGSIGTGAAEALRQRGCRVTGFNRSGARSDAFDAVIGLDSLDASLQTTDILVSTLPLTTHTAALIDRRRIDLLPHGAGVIVVGRANVLDYDALFDRLDAGTLGGAVLDVFPTEPAPPDNRVWHTPRLIMTPHCSVDDHVHYLAGCLAIFLDNLERFIDGRTLRNIVDPVAGY